MTRRLLPALLALLLVLAPAPGQWVRPRSAGDAKLWGVEGGIVVGVHPDLRDTMGRVTPRGLIRIGLLRDGEPELLNFVAIEPLVGRARGLSELERSADDGRPGKRFRLANLRGEAPRPVGVAVPGVVSRGPEGGVLSFVIHAERFANGAAPVLEVSLFEKAPRRVRFRTFAAAGSSPIDQLTLSATMGNLARCRHLWLADAPVGAFGLYHGYRGRGFVEHAPYPRDRLHRTADGTLVVAITPDEFDPSEVRPFSDDAWRCPLPWLTQYWLKPPGTFDASVTCRVNGRRVYWRSSDPLPGGIAYENFELRERFRDGQEIWFGIDPRSPAALFGFSYDLPPSQAVSRTVDAAEQARRARAARTRQPLTNGSFRDGLRAWTADPDPTPFRLFEAEGAPRLTTFGARRDADRGRLFQCFLVPPDARALRFHLHGGCHPEHLRVNLWDGERLARWMTARNDNRPFEVRFDLVPLRKRVATLEIVDASSAPWGFLGVHGFEVLTR